MICAEAIAASQVTNIIGSRGFLMSKFLFSMRQVKADHTEMRHLK